MRGRNHDVRGLAVRAVLFRGSRDLIPLYALYALLFADHGLNTAQISLLLAMWSVTAFVLEVPSGAWADTVSRRVLLILSALLMCTGFTVWTVAPSFLGFGIGFVVWGVASALESGTFEALVYDELAASDASASYPKIMGYTRAAQESAVVVAILAASPLYAWGGYALVGWVSVGIAGLHCLIALTLPSPPKAVSAADVEDLDDDAPAPVPSNPGDIRSAGSAAPTTFTRYRTMLRDGIGESLRVRRVRYGVLLIALIYGVTAYDEYFALLAQDAGISTTIVPLLVGVTVLGSLTGSLVAGRTEAMSGRVMGAASAVGGALFIGGAIATGLAAQRPGFAYPLAVIGFVAIGIAYGIVFNTEVVAEARLQDAIEGKARATVTSVSGLLSEVVALAVFGFVAVVTRWFALSTTVALLGAAMLVTAVVAPAWLPRRVDRADED
ncbi:MFS transporter [Nocardia sp. NEAU-351]|uniref:MFS transporter n=1 Tax=Nocardia bovistercoris TaxID=2785916 RepID=A0A931IEL8_9NOCA|nr:MFS transporter [Nocardia bovistercoris]